MEFLTAAILKFKMEALDVNGKTGTHFFSWSVKFLDVIKHGCQESTQQNDNSIKHYISQQTNGSVQKQPGLYQTMTPIFCYSHLKTVNLTCV